MNRFLRLVISFSIASAAPARALAQHLSPRAAGSGAAAAQVPAAGFVSLPLESQGAKLSRTHGFSPGLALPAPLAAPCRSVLKAKAGAAPLAGKRARKASRWAAHAWGTLVEAGAELEKTGARPGDTLDEVFQGSESRRKGVAVVVEGKKASPSRRLLKAAAGVGVVTLLAAVPLLRNRTAFEAFLGPLGAGLFPAILGAMAQVGNIVGNGLAMVFPVPQIYKTAQDGHMDATPLGRSMLMVGASLALGLVNAVLAHAALWGVQNIFGALMMLSVIPVGKLLQWRAKGGLGLGAPLDPSWPAERKLVHRILHDHALFLTGLVVALGLPASLAMFQIASLAVPPLLGVLFPAAFIPELALILQVATSVMFLMIFIPDAVNAWRKTRSKGFTPAFSLLFFLCNAALLFWSVFMTLSQRVYSPQMWQFLVYSLVNVVYCATSFVSYRLSREKAKALG